MGAVRSDRQTGEFTRIHDLAKAVYFVIWERQGLPGAGGGRAGQGSELAGRSGCVGHSGARWLAPAPAFAAREDGAVRNSRPMADRGHGTYAHQWHAWGP